MPRLTPSEKPRSSALTTRYFTGASAAGTRRDTGALEHARKDALSVEELLHELARRARVALVVALDLLDCRRRLVGRLHAEEPAPGRKDVAEAGVLRDDGPSRGQVAGATVAEPTGAKADVLVLGDREFSPRGEDVA